MWVSADVELSDFYGFSIGLHFNLLLKNPEADLVDTPYVTSKTIQNTPKEYTVSSGLF